MKTTFEYGELYDIAPTFGVDTPEGKIQIIGILNYHCLPSWVDFQAWATGEAEFDWDLMEKPWYTFLYCEDFEEEVHILPEWALENVIHKANVLKVKRWRNQRYMENFPETEAIR